MNSYISGEKWLNITGVSAHHYVYNNYFWVNPTSSTQNSYITLFMQTTNITCNITDFYVENDAQDLWIYFYNANGQEMFHLWRGGSFGTLMQLVKDGSVVVEGEGVSGYNTFFLTVLFNTSTGEYFLNTSGDVTFNSWFLPTNTDYISYIKIRSVGDTTNMILDNFKVAVGDTPFLWEEDSQVEVGSVTLTGNELSAQLIAFDNLIVESDFKISASINLKRIGIAVGENTDIDNLDIRLKVGNYAGGGYDNYYSYNDRFILVWDLDKTITTTNPQFELNFIKTGGSPEIKILYTNNDIDSDSDTEFKYSYGTDNLNGVYDGDVTENNDLIYKLWYNYTDDDIYDYGDVTNYTKFCSLTPPLQYASIYSQECNFLGMCFDSDTKYLEVKMTSKLTTYIEVVDLYVHENQYNLNNGNLELYQLFINGEDCQNPSIWVPLDDGNYILRWLNCNIPLDNEEPIFEFYSLSAQYINRPFGQSFFSHWVGVGMHNKRPQWSSIKAHAQDGLYGNGVLNGEQVRQEYDNKMISMCFYTDDYNPNPEYDDTIIVQPLDRTQYQEYDVLTISGTISVQTPNTYIQLWKDGTQITTQGYANNGLFVKDYSFKEFFALNSKNYDGNWQVHLNRGGTNISTYNFTVIDRTDYNGHLYTYPTVSNVGEQFKIGYLYNKTYYDNNNGAVLYGRFPEFNPNYNVIFDNIQEDNEKDYIHNKEEIMYMFLCVKENGTYTPISNHVHYVGDYYTNEIHVNDKELYLTRDIQGNLIPAKQTFYGYHSYTTSDVYIYDNGKKLKDISSTPNFNINYDYYSSGNHNISLVLDKGNGNIEILDTTSFIIYGESQEEQQFLGLLPLVIGYVLGLVLLMIAMIGLAIFSKNRNLHYSIYLIVGTSVAIFNVLIGAWEWWTILFFSTVIIAVVVMELSKKYSSNN